MFFPFAQRILILFLTFEIIKTQKTAHHPTSDAGVLGGWLVMVGPPEGDLRPAFFLPDPNHTWEALSIRNKEMAAV